MKETLVQSEQRLTQGMDPEKRALRARNHLLEIAENIRREAKYGLSQSKQELAMLDAERIEQAAKLLHIGFTEVFRLRASIGHYKYGMMAKHELTRIPDTWNGGEPVA